MSKISVLESKEPDRLEIQKKLKQAILTMYKQIINGCPRKICYNTYCHKNLICRKSKS